MVSQSFTRISHRWAAAYHYLHKDALYVANGKQLAQWRNGSDVIAMEWMSKKFIVPHSALVTCARIQCPAPELLAVSFIADDVEIYSLTFGELTNQPFRLPPVRAFQWQVKVTGSVKVERIILADTVSELY
ncbi:hypothetical protein DN39_1927 [Vibrio cholerae]|nr:hypothetical protein DN39_1927 [Vibrio cholerae]